MTEYLKRGFDNYTNFKGRERRKNYWMWTLSVVVVYVAIAILTRILSAISENLAVAGVALYTIFALAIIIPSLAFVVRRLHDTGKSGWYYLIALIPLIGGIIVLVALCTDSVPGENQYGPNPKTGEAEIKLDPLS